MQTVLVLGVALLTMALIARMLKIYSQRCVRTIRDGNCCR